MTNGVTHVTDAEIIYKYATPVPRYTSYPTAPQFSRQIDASTYSAWLSQLAHNAPLSLYTHIPFCRELCWYCGCATKMTKRYEPVATYLNALYREISHVSRHLGSASEVQHVHWGGGSPNILAPSDIVSLAENMRRAFNWSIEAEFAVEIDPRFASTTKTDAFVKAGVNRVSLGVQDFADPVQAAINRHQSFSDTARIVNRFRGAGVRSINIDLVYGLPHQTHRSVERTIEQVLSLEPDRIAVFGYAHLPDRIKHQRMIDEGSLPNLLQRHEQSCIIADRILAAGYEAVGLDHYARPTDTLIHAPVKRNFQGYTSDGAETLIGLGASAIGKLPQGYVQNAATSGEYIRRISEDGLAVARGVALSADDRIRAKVIDRLMCDLEFSASDLGEFDDDVAAPVLSEARVLLQNNPDQLLEGTSDGFRVTSKGRPFIRTICSHFDRYLERGGARHAVGI